MFPILQIGISQNWWKIGFDIIPENLFLEDGLSGINSKSKNKEEAFNFIKWATSQKISIPYTILGGVTPRLNLFKTQNY